MSRLCLYFKHEPETDRWVPGDRFIRPLIRRAVRGRRRPGGVEKVWINLRLGLDRLGVRYEVNLPFKSVRADDRVGVLGRGRHCLEGYDRPNPIVAGIGLMTHPSEWPTLCDDYPVVKYLQHSEWANRVYRPYFGERCTIWPVGIDTDRWRQLDPSVARTEILLYDKVMWNRPEAEQALVEPIREELRRRGLSFVELKYGNYRPEEFLAALRRSRAMIFLCEHESQGIGYQEALSCDVPILAWDQGWYLDPNRARWGQPEVPATSVPYWDERCGVKFASITDFPSRLDEFLELAARNVFAPRDYILENLTLEDSARRFLTIVDVAQTELASPGLRGPSR